MLELLRVIQALVEEDIPEPKFYSMFNSIFKYESFYKWSLDEIRREAVANPNMEGEDILHNYIVKMDNEACNAKDPEVKFMFSTAEDTGKYVLDEFLTTINTYYDIAK